ncbi:MULTISPECIES: MSMEG_0565 family glycosyltransferase [Leptolyngbya]|uniref:MSMEG_0565 family glycosyltransferase n=1 Tax=Leptolyngbya TaxID=47251 RepID=UPI001686D7DE|nr:MSMEG_0565 family glycosyltransferase [Leptolyngbya sp. FACHB-1624]MBD1855455.1 MSMEG_0565 family glycosyltransferase [Leptolyngbya sp. FACHB-1624]
MKIALLTYSTKPRGSVIHTLELAEALHDLGHSVCVFALDKDGKGFDYPLSCQVQLIPARPAPSEIDQLIAQRIQEFVNYFNQFPQQFDCYHAQDCLSANALAILREQGYIPHFVRTVHHIEDYQSIYLQQCQDRSIREASLCFCVSDRWKSELQEQYQINAPRVINGVNLKRFSAQNHFLDFSGHPIYLTVGGIEPRKNSIRLLQAFQQVRTQFPKAQLVIAGGATLFDYQAYRDEFFAIAESLNLKHSLVLLGVVADADLPKLYQSADVFVFPSVKEGWGLVILEAIASKIPVITSKQPPFTEFLNETQALLVDPYSVDAIASAMCSVFDSADSLVAQSQSVLSQYTWKISAQQHIHHYQTLLYA